MIQVVWQQAGQPVRQGSAELIDAWQQDANSVIWIDMEGEDRAMEAALLQRFGCHALAIAYSQRDRRPPKVEDFDDHTFIRYRGIATVRDELEMDPLDISLFVGERFLITCHRKASVSISHWRDDEPRLSNAIQSPASLAVGIMHYSFGFYIDHLLAFEGRLGELEDSIQEREGNDVMMQELVLYKSRLRKLNRVFAYHERVSNQLKAEPFPGFDLERDGLPHEIRGLYDRSERLLSLGTMYYGICGDLIEGYLSLSSHQLNHTMKILTVITAVFVPLSFLAGLYGMNFEYIPELQFRNGYFFLLGTMAALACGLLWLFRRKGWL